MEEARTPVPAMEEQHEVRPSRRLRRGLRLLLPLTLFAGIFGMVYWLTPVKPFANLELKEASGFILFSPDSATILSAKTPGFNKAGPVRIWDVQSGVERFSVAENWNDIETIRFSPDGSLFGIHPRQGRLNLYRADTGEELASLIVNASSRESGFCFSPDGRFLAFEDSSKGSIHYDWITFWSIDRRQEAGSIEGEFSTLAFAPDGKSAATCIRGRGTDNRIMLWRLEETQSPVLIREQRVPGSGPVYSPDLKTVAVALDFLGFYRQIVLWDTTTGKDRDRFLSPVAKNNLAGPGQLSYTANGQILLETMHGPGGIRSRQTLWDVSSTPKLLGSWESSLAISPDGAWITVPDLFSAQGPPPGVKLLQTSGMHERGLLTRKDDMGFWFLFESEDVSSFSPDSSMVLVNGQATPPKPSFLSKWLPVRFNPFPDDPGGPVVRVWDVHSTTEVMAFRHCRQGYFSPDGKVLATRHEDHTLKLWHLPFRKPIWRMLGWTAGCWLVIVLFQQLLVRRWRRFNADCEKQPSGASPC